MRIRILWLAAALAAAVAAPATGATLRGEVVEIGVDSITVTSGDRTVTYLVPTDVQIQAPQREQLSLPELRPGQRVTLVVEEPPARGETAPTQPQALTIRVDGDVEVD